MDKALADLRKSGNLPIPRHLRDGHYAGSKTLGNAQDYKIPSQLSWQLGPTGLPARQAEGGLLFHS